MTILETMDSLTEKDRLMVINYFVSGGLFILFAYVVYYCRHIKTMIRSSIALLMLSRSFVLLSEAGKFLEGDEGILMRDMAQWGVILSTFIGFWVMIEFIKWNKRKQLEK